MNIQHPYISKRYRYKTKQTFTPTLSATILAHFNTMNPRPIDKNEAQKRLAPTLTRGEWLDETGLNIAFLKDGQLGDGQHRLEACVESGIPFVSDVAYGLTREAIALRDTQRTRSVGVSWAWVLGGGHDVVAKLKNAVAITRVWMRFTDDWKNMRYTRKQMLEFYLQHHDPINAMMERRENKDANRSGFRAACAFYYTINRKKALKLFADVSGNGDGINPQSPAGLLRRHFASVHLHPEAQLVNDFAATLSMAHAIENGQTTLPAISYMLKWV